ncbi:GntR family transcriptional regulator [Streptosporangium sp. NPDC000239]|uniref:GntR family transcriptional regulator n=1 Tax=Streptosporangium sp. NPDC000239 TaxID=3154248 RepID=UPI003317C16F
MAPRERYREIADDLRKRIREGEWPPGQRIPKTIALSAEYQAARGSISRAIDELEAEGILLSTPRRGTFVLAQRPRRRVSRVPRVYRRRLAGYSFGATAPGEVWVNHIPPFRSLEPIPARAAELLDVAPGTLVLRRRRVTSPEGEPPFGLSDSWIHPEVAAEAPKVAEQGAPGGYLDAIEAVGHGPLAWQEITRARTPDKEEASLLGIPAELPVVEICRVAVSASTERPVEVTMTVVPADRIEVVATVERDASARYEVLSPPGGRPDHGKEP